MCGSLEMANKCNSGVKVVHGCATEGGNSILQASSWELLKMKLQDN